jgi:hypothetical protein
MSQPEAPDSGVTMSKWSRGALVVAVSMLVILGGGCVDRTVKGDEVGYGYSWWVPVVELLGAMAALPQGLVTRRRSSRFGWGLMILAPLLALVVFPAMILDRVKVDSEHFEAHYGFWFAPSRPSVRFDDLRELRHVTYKQRGRRGRVTTKHKLVCFHLDGQQETVALGDLLRRAEPDIIERAQAKNVAITAEGP